MSQTHTIRRSVPNPARTHDYLYDPTHTLSSERDHARATFKAHTSMDRVKRVPDAVNMFSELRHRPRFSIRLEATDPVPKFINRQWKGYAEQAREALIRYTTFNYDPSVNIPSKHFEDAHVTGQSRYKYFRRPIIPFLQQVPPEVILQTTKVDPLAGPDSENVRPATPLTRTIEVQTDYRDSEAQTDPFTPEYVVRPGSQPELLTLATLSHGHGLPAGLAEVEMIERARAKRAWEATLPPLSDTSQLETRKAMMDEMERKEWALREREIEKLQEARLEVLKKILREREENHQELNVKRLDRLWSRKQREREAKVTRIRHEHIKAIRKLTAKRQRVEGKKERRKITHDYSNYGSQAYAPITRIGVFHDRNSEQYVVKSKYLNSFQGLLELEDSLPVYVTQPRIKPPKPKSSLGGGSFTKRAKRREKELAEVHQAIKDASKKAQEPPKPLRFLEKIEKPVPRPPTPSVEVPDQVEEERELAIIFLQQVIRGRAIQNMMFEGKEKRLELIQELRSTHALQNAEQQMLKQEKQATMQLQRQRKLYENKESFIEEAMAQMEGGSVGDMLDFLSKELIRLQEERRIHAFSMLAERQRRIREAEESGRRQVEERRRREEDEVFKQVVKVHQDSVDTYLEDVILGAVDHTATEQARLEIQGYAQKINDIAYEMEERRTKLESEEIVSELVHSFLLPEAQKQTMKEKVRNAQRKHLLAAHRAVHKDTEEALPMFAKAIPTDLTTPPKTHTSTSKTGEKQKSSSRPSSVRRRSPEVVSQPTDTAMTTTAESSSVSQPTETAVTTTAESSSAVAGPPSPTTRADSPKAAEEKAESPPPSYDVVMEKRESQLHLDQPAGEQPAAVEEPDQSGSISAEQTPPTADPQEPGTETDVTSKEVEAPAGVEVSGEETAAAVATGDATTEAPNEQPPPPEPTQTTTDSGTQD